MSDSNITCIPFRIVYNHTPTLSTRILYIIIPYKNLRHSTVEQIFSETCTPEDKGYESYIEYYHKHIIRGNASILKDYKSVQRVYKGTKFRHS